MSASLRWHACGGMRKVDVISRPPGVKKRRLSRRVRHGCRRLRFWLITHPTSNYRVPHGRSKKEDFAIAAEFAAVASRAEACRLRRMSELRRVEAAASPMRILRVL